MAKKKHMGTIRLEANATSIWHELRTQRDRAVGVIGGAMVDEALQSALTCKWLLNDLDLTVEVRNNILRDGGPLTFSTKIDLAYLMHLIGPTVHGELKRINRLRNSFAHRVLIDDPQRRPTPVTFKTQSIRDACMAFRMVDEYNTFLGSRKLPTRSARHRYLATVLILTTALGLYSASPNKESKVVDLLLKR